MGATPSLRGVGEGLSFFARPDIFDLQLYLAALVRILFNAVADVERTFALDETSLRTLAKGDAADNR